MSDAPLMRITAAYEGEIPETAVRITPDHVQITISPRETVLAVECYPSTLREIHRQLAEYIAREQAWEDEQGVVR